MKINGNEVRPGNMIEHNHRLWIVVKADHVKPGKGGAYAQVELKDIRDGTKSNERFRSSETVERVRLDDHEYQFLFAEGTSYTFMNQENYEQVVLDANIVGESGDFLQEGMIVKVSSYEEETISITLPDTVVMTIIESDPVIKGQTATSSFKPAILENGIRIMVPPHIDTGTRIVVNTADRTYVERAKD
jgi:elongation factor P